MDKLSEHAIRMLKIVDNERGFYKDMDGDVADIARAIYDLILQVQMLKKFNRKSNSSEKPNNSTISKMEQVEITADDFNEGDEFCEDCRWFNPKRSLGCDLDDDECHYEPKDEPQTEEWICPNCGDRVTDGTYCKQCGWIKNTEDEPHHSGEVTEMVEPQTAECPFDDAIPCEWVNCPNSPNCPYKPKDESKSCATCRYALGDWDGKSNNCERCCGTDRRFYEPQTEGSNK